MSEEADGHTHDGEARIDENGGDDGGERAPARVEYVGNRELSRAGEDCG